MTRSPENMPCMELSTPVCCSRMKSKVAALDIDSQYTIFPLAGITTTRPGSSKAAEGVVSEPRGSGSEVYLEGYGREKVNVSGEVVVAV
jgi:hypothetical protein